MAGVDLDREAGVFEHHCRDRFQRVVERTQTVAISPVQTRLVLFVQDGKRANVIFFGQHSKDSVGDGLAVGKRHASDITTNLKVVNGDP